MLHYVRRYNFIALSIFIFLTINNSYAQGKQDKSSLLLQIKKAVHGINKYNNFKVVTIGDSEEFLGNVTDNGAELKGYYKGDSLKKIVEWIGLSNRIIQNEYYFDKAKLVFVYSTDSRCKFNDHTEEFDCSKFVTVFQGRYYFSNNKLIHTIISDKDREKSKQTDATTFLTFGINYTKLLNARRD